MRANSKSNFTCLELIITVKLRKQEMRSKSKSNFSYHELLITKHKRIAGQYSRFPIKWNSIFEGLCWKFLLKFPFSQHFPNQFCHWNLRSCTISIFRRFANLQCFGEISILSGMYCYSISPKRRKSFKDFCNTTQNRWMYWYQVPSVRLTNCIATCIL